MKLKLNWLQLKLAPIMLPDANFSNEKSVGN
jgi:hypothetical protein